MWTKVAIQFSMPLQSISVFISCIPKRLIDFDTSLAEISKLYQLGPKWPTDISISSHTVEIQNPIELDQSGRDLCERVTPFFCIYKCNIVRV